MPAASIFFPWADFAQECSDAAREAVAASAIHPAPCFPDVAHQHSGEQIVNNTCPLEERKADAGNENAADDLVGIFGGRSGRVSQNDERKKKRGFDVRRAI